MGDTNSDGMGGERPGEGFGSTRPGNEYGAGERGYAGREGPYREHDARGGYRSDYGDRGAGGQGFGGGAYGGGYGGGSRILDDMARFVTDAAGAAQGVRREVETAFRAQAESILGRMDVVRRDEFEAMAEMAARAREEADALRARVEALEARLGMGETEAGGEG